MYIHPPKGAISAILWSPWSVKQTSKVDPDFGWHFLISAPYADIYIPGFSTRWVCVKLMRLFEGTEQDKITVQRYIEPYS